MNITLLGHYDIASLFALDRVIRQLPEHRHSVLLSSAAAADPAAGASLAGLAQADAELCTRFLAGELAGPVVAPLASGAIGSLENPNSAAGLARLGAGQPELLVSIRYRRILRDAAIAIPRRGVLNLHSGILPDYRGVMATFWAMQNGEEQIGTTLHWIVDAGIDTGPVIGIRRRATEPQRSYLANVLGLYIDGCDMLAAAIAAVAAGEPLPAEQHAGSGQYFQAPGSADVARFESAGLALVDQHEAAAIRAARTGI